MASSKFVFANFEDLGGAARPMGMANAFTALATDVNALYYNPAGLARVGIGEIATSYTRYLLGLSDQSVLGGGYVAGVLPLSELGRHGVGVSYTNFHLFGTYQEHAVTIGYGLEVARDLSVGANVKGLFASFVQDAYTVDDPLFSQFGYATWNVGVDLGCLWQPLPNYRLAAMVLNVNQPNMALSGDDRVPLIGKVGMAYRAAGMDVAADFTYQPGNSDWRAGFGVEKWFAERSFAARGGLVVGAREDRDVTAGATYRADQLQFDYAFVYPLTGLSRTIGTHRLAFSVRFGQPPVESEEEFAVVEMVPKAVYEAEIARASAAAQLAQAEVEVLKAKLDEAARAAKQAKEASEAKEANEELKAELADRETKLAVMRAELEVAQAKLAEAERARLARIEAAKRAPSPSPLPQGERVSTSSSPLTGEDRGGGGVPRTYTVKEGETLRSIAKKFYNDEEQWMSIYRLNASNIRQGIVIPGQILYLPQVKP